jgi:hypothetical protein
MLNYVQSDYSSMFSSSNSMSAIGVADDPIAPALRQFIGHSTTIMRHAELTLPVHKYSTS